MSKAKCASSNRCTTPAGVVAAASAPGERSNVQMTLSIATSRCDASTAWNSNIPEAQVTRTPCTAPAAKPSARAAAAVGAGKFPWKSPSGGIAVCSYRGRSQANGPSPENNAARSCTILVRYAARSSRALSATAHGAITPLATRHGPTATRGTARGCCACDCTANTKTASANAAAWRGGRRIVVCRRGGCDGDCNRFARQSCARGCRTLRQRLATFQIPRRSRQIVDSALPGWHALRRNVALITGRR